MQHLEQSLLDESAMEEAEELKRLKMEDIDAIISSLHWGQSYPILGDGGAMPLSSVMVAAVSGL